MTIPKPSPLEIDKYLRLWNSLENYVLQERSLTKLFSVTYPRNVEMDDVLIKVCSLNDFYSTNIFSPFKVAMHIVSLKIDERLEANDLTLVNEIANVEVKTNKRMSFYSFASKYCSHHKPMIYPIYDSYVDKLVMYFKKVDHFFYFKRKDLKNYPNYKDVLIGFRTFYHLEAYDLKQVDKYLWQVGKQYFPRNY